MTLQPLMPAQSSLVKSDIKTNIEAKLLSQQSITGDELFTMHDVGWAELVEGEVIQQMPTGFLHGKIEFLIGILLGLFVRQHQLGIVFGGETGIYTRRNPDTVRGVDAAYISHERLAQSTSNSYLDVAPELIVEIMSPDDSWTNIDDKLTEYFAIGVELVWIVNPKRQQIHVYTARTQFEVLNRSDTLNGGSILPGFEVTVAEIFE